MHKIMLGEKFFLLLFEAVKYIPAQNTKDNKVSYYELAKLSP